MANHEIDEIEDAIIVALKAKMTYLKHCDTYGGELVDALPRYAGPLPAVFAEYAGRHFEGEDAEDQLFSAPWRFNVYVAASNLRSEKFGRRGTTGCYTMLKDAKEALVGKTVGLLDFLPFKPIDEQIILNEGGLVAYILQVAGKSYYHVT